MMRSLIGNHVLGLLKVKVMHGILRVNQGHDSFSHINAFHGGWQLVLFYLLDLPSPLDLNMLGLILIVHLKPIVSSVNHRDRSFNKRRVCLAITKSCVSQGVVVGITMAKMVMMTITLGPLVQIAHNISSSLSGPTFCCVSSKRLKSKISWKGWKVS